MALRLVSVRRGPLHDDAPEEAGDPLTGFGKERALTEFIAAQSQSLTEENSGERPCLQVAVAIRFDSNGDLLQGARVQGQLKALVMLLELQKRVLLPAAPFLAFLFSNALDRLVGSASRSAVNDAALEVADEGTAEDCKESEEAAGVAQAADEGFDKREAGQRGRGGCKKARLQVAGRKHCVRLCLEGLGLLLENFPALASSWPSLLRPGKEALKRLLEAAVETGSTSGAGNIRGGGLRSRRAVPFVVAFVCSWSKRPVRAGRLRPLRIGPIRAPLKGPSASAFCAGILSPLRSTPARRPADAALCDEKAGAVKLSPTPANPQHSDA